MRIEYEPRHTAHPLESTSVQTTPLLVQSLAGIVITTALFCSGAYVLFFGIPASFLALIPVQQSAVAAAVVSSNLSIEFKNDQVLIETSTPDESAHPFLWLQSGAKFFIRGSSGATIQGALPMLDIWRFRYARTSDLDTEGGYAPQNLFRLITRSHWDNVRTQLKMRIVRDNFTESPLRNATNGIYIMSRYQNNESTYVAGLRVDGTAVIRKQSTGQNFIMAKKKLFSGSYVRENDINLLPHGEWISLRTDTVTNTKGVVTITLFMKRATDSEWITVLSAIDDGKKYENTPPLTGAFPIGIRTDFMDVEFDSLEISPIP